jgi:deoxyguanosine kinase
MKNIPFIAVEGPIGVGKTSLSKCISNELGYPLLKEIVEENPFLNKFYDNQDEWSFQTEMFFLCNRYKQLHDIEKEYLEKNQGVVADYHIFKNTIFAQQTLHNGEYEKYMKIYDILTKDMPVPNVIVYLNASLDTLLKRISFRGRSFEENIDPRYLQTLSNDYEIFMKRFKETHPDVPVLFFSGDEYDFVNNPKHLDDMLKKIKAEVEKQS